jgi:hypothetical protein
MSNMQVFHKWLSSTSERPNASQRTLSRLARVSRAQILAIASDLIWYLWDAEKPTSA